MAEREPEEFYVGYLPQAPPQLARRVRLTVLLLLVLAALAAVIFVFGQHKFPPAVFEFGNVREFAGIVREKPLPLLLVKRAGEAGTLPVFQRYLLVAEGKHGAQEEVSGLDGMQVDLRGTLIHRDGKMMIEVAHNSVFIAPQSERTLKLPDSETVSEALGTYTLTGEIVDSKCWLGVMNPGSTKVHRACASLCISGGVPPMLIARDAEGRTAHLLLTSADGSAINQAVLDFVAEPVEITGEVVREGDQLFLRAAPQTFRRIQ